MQNISLEQAVDAILHYVSEIKEIEYVSIVDAAGRILAEDLCAEFDNPPFDRSPVDGYACKAEDLIHASEEHPVSLKVLCEIDAGEYKQVVVHSGEAVRIMTGAVIPAGCNCCVYQEKTDYGEDIVQIMTSMKEWQNYCFKGEDYKKGTVLVHKDTKLTYIETAIAASMGLTSVPVYRLPSITLLTTGDEVTAPGAPLPPGKIYDCNQTLLASRLKGYGVSFSTVTSVKDDPQAVAEALCEAAKHSDLIITTGGVSVGKKDIMHEAIRVSGAERVFWKISLKPGMPTLFSVLHNVPVLSLSGNPFGVAVTAEVLIRPVLCKMKHDPDVDLKYRSAVLRGCFSKYSPVRRMVRATYTDGEVTLPDGLHSNGVLASMAGCNCLIDLPAGTGPIEDGTSVSVLML